MDLQFIRSLYDNPASQNGNGYASAYLDMSPGMASPSREVAQRWRSARSDWPARAPAR